MQKAQAPSGRLGRENRLSSRASQVAVDRITGLRHRAAFANRPWTGDVSMSMRRFAGLALVVVALVGATSSAAPTAVQEAPQVVEVLWSPNGDWLAFSREGDGVYVIRADRSGARHFAVGNLDPGS